MYSYRILKNKNNVYKVECRSTLDAAWLPFSELKSGSYHLQKFKNLEQAKDAIEKHRLVQTNYNNETTWEVVEDINE